jgi:hypothetical protein
MDLVMLLEHEGVPKQPGVFSAAGIERLLELIGWLARSGARSDVYVVVPRGAAHLVEPLSALAPLLAGATSGTTRLVIDAADAHAPAVRALTAANVEHVVRDDRADGAAARDALPSRDPASFVEPAAHLPAELLGGGLLCELYAHALTFDAGGEVRPCTRYARGAGLGNVMTVNAETLLERKGASFAAVMSGGPCRTCTAPARFAWQSRGSEAVQAAFAAGANAVAER